MFDILPRIGGIVVNVNLTPRLEEMVRQKVETGLYNNASEVVREALRLMEARDRLDRLKMAIAHGDRQFEQGETFAFTPQLIEEMKLDAQRMTSEGVDPDPDVCP